MSLSLEKLKLFKSLLDSGRFVIDKDDNIFSVSRQGKNPVCTGSNKLPMVAIFTGGKQWSIGPHVLVWIKYHGIPENIHVDIIRKDCDVYNWKIDNLELITMSERNMEQARNGIHNPLRGEQVANALFTDQLVMEYRQLYASGQISIGEIRKKHGVSKTTVIYMLSGRAYKHLPVPERTAPVKRSDHDRVRQPRKKTIKSNTTLSHFLSYHLLNVAKLHINMCSRILDKHNIQVYRLAKDYDKSKYEDHKRAFIKKYAGKPKVFAKFHINEQRLDSEGYAIAI